MSWRPYPVGPRGATALVAALLGLALAAAPAGAAERLHPVRRGATISAAAEEGRVAAYWTPQRRREVRPLDGPPGGEPPDASASFRPVEDATLAPYLVNGRIFLRQGRQEGYCSGTVIDSASRRLILTAGHCVNSGPIGFSGSSAWSRYMEFVPAYADGAAPFGAFIARRNAVYAPKQWVKTANSNFDVGAILTGPNEEGVYPADAVNGVTIALDQPRGGSFQTFGYPGNAHRLQHCSSPTTGEDAYTRTQPGPPTVKIRCRWAPGASGGGWLIEGGTEIDGLTSYGHDGDSVHTFGPYFSSKNVGALVKGF